MKKTILFKSVLFILLAFCTSLLHAQLKENYVKATVVLQNGQVLNGFIKEEELSKMNNKIKFKDALSNKKIETYDTTQVKSVSTVEGEQYELLSYKGHEMTSPNLVLAKLLIRGKASLYKMLYEGLSIYLITNNDKCYVLQNDELKQNDMQITQYYYKSYLEQALVNSITSKQIERVSFHESDFKKIVTDYNTSSNAENVVFANKKKAKHFIVVSAEGVVKNKDEKEFSFKVVYRTFLPKVSRSTSLNIGIHYFNYKFIELNWYREKIPYTQQLITVPFQLQQNLLNKNVRPYLFGGANISYLKVVNAKKESQIKEGLQKNFGIGLLYGAGIEVDIYKGAMLKSEFRHENFGHLLMIGVGYYFSTKK